MRFGGIWVAGKRRGSTWVVFGSCFAGSWPIPGRVPAAPIRLAARTDISSAVSGSLRGRQRASGHRFLARRHAGNTASRQRVQVDAQISRTQPAALSSSWGCLLGSLSVACVVIIMGLSLWRWLPPGGARPPPDASVAPCPANGQRGADPWHLGGVWVAFQLA